MLTWLFLALFFHVAESNRKLFSFNPDKTILSECIEDHMVTIDDQYKSTLVAKETARFFAGKFHGKTMLSYVFDKRFRNFLNDLRKGKVCIGIDKDQLTEKLRKAVKQSLIFCAEENLVSLPDITEREELEKTLLDKDLISFTSDKYLLSECIQNHLKLTGHREFNLDSNFVEFISNLAANQYYGRSMSKRNFNSRNNWFFYDLKKSKMLQKIITDKLSVEIELSIIQAMKDCAIGKPSLAAVPTFKNEPPDTAQLLDLILVKWPINLRKMVESQVGRAVLRSYAKDARAALIHELDICHNNTQMFRVSIRTYWNNRAQEMYDANSVELPYIGHSYTLFYPTPHMILSNFDALIKRRRKNFSERSPLVRRSNLDEILNIHISDRLNNNGIVDIFDVYYNNGMTSAEYYFENQINQFYRIIFFFLELQARGICTDENDIYDGSLPNDLIPEKIQAIIYDDDVYRDYLLDERFFYDMLMDNNTQNKIAQDLIGTARVLEENLVLLRSNMPSTSGIQLNSEFLSLLSATTTETIGLTTQSLKRKDNVWKNENGKCFSRKRAKSTGSNGNINNSDMKDLNAVTKSPIQKTTFTDSVNETLAMCSELCATQDQDNNYDFGYMTSDDDFYQQFSYEDFLILQEIPLLTYYINDHDVI